MKDVSEKYREAIRSELDVFCAEMNAARMVKRLEQKVAKDTRRRADRRVPRPR